MVEESRHRLLRLEGVSYLTQYEDGRILQKTTHELHSRTEELAEVDEGLFASANSMCIRKLY